MINHSNYKNWFAWFAISGMLNILLFKLMTTAASFLTIKLNSQLKYAKQKTKSLLIRKVMTLGNTLWNWGQIFLLYKNLIQRDDKQGTAKNICQLGSHKYAWLENQCLTYITETGLHSKVALSAAEHSLSQQQFMSHSFPVRSQRHWPITGTYTMAIM